MRNRLLSALVAGVLLALLWAGMRPHRPVPVVAAPGSFSGAVHGACYASLPVQCRIHVAGWQPISVNPGEKLLGIQLRANDEALYNLRTDATNPPASNYTPSLVALDFGARCGMTYTLTLLAEDTGSGGLAVVGETNPFTCPLPAPPTATPIPKLYLPSLRR